MAGIAVLIDGEYFLRQIQYHLPELKPIKGNAEEELIEKADLTAKLMSHYCRSHCWQRDGTGSGDTANTAHMSLHRIFFYDCLPLEGEKVLPISGAKEDFSQKEAVIFRKAFLKGHKGGARGIIAERKVVLRLGKLVDTNEWVLRDTIQKSIARNNGSYANPKDAHFKLNTRQKGVDMRLGIDIASLAYKKLVSQIILIAGDSDFVPAIKLARREGIDIVVDSLGKNISADMMEHIDGMQSHWRQLEKSLGKIKEKNATRAEVSAST